MSMKDRRWRGRRRTREAGKRANRNKGLRVKISFLSILIWPS